MKTIISCLLSASLFTSCLSGIPKGKSKAITHETFTKLLQKNVNDKGFVNYKAFIKDSVALNNYLTLLSNNAPANSWTKNEKFAYWINAYNAFTIKLITNNYPVKSIKDLQGNNAVIFINTVWDKKFFKIGGKFATMPPVVINSIAALCFKNKHPCGCCNQFIATVVFSLAQVRWWR